MSSSSTTEAAATIEMYKPTVDIFIPVVFLQKPPGWCQHSDQFDDILCH